MGCDAHFQNVMDNMIITLLHMMHFIELASPCFNILTVAMVVFFIYPELICLDATYKLLELGLPVYLMLRED